MVRKISLSKPKPDQATTENPYSLFFPDDIKNQLSRIKKKDNVLFEQLRKRFEKLITNPECGEVLSHDKAGHREVHVKDHWVIIYRTDYDVRTIVIVKIGTHEKALGR
ncbi:MAG: Plasmid stabilization system protein [Methanosaeta sp. PtaU1.Bin112]|jgi:addiction module RelE/StbE family toxin|nr:MAG: Plasmid stabilization system protein [Methanosaeta sp. PtaU1.Bin112]